MILTYLEVEFRFAVLILIVGRVGGSSVSF